MVVIQSRAAMFSKDYMHVFITLQYGGNPVSCAIALAVLDVIDGDKLRENAVTVGKYLVDQLTDLRHKHSLIGDIRGCGLFVGVELVTDLISRSPATVQAEHIIYRYTAYRAHAVDIFVFIQLVSFHLDYSASRL